MSGRNEYQVYSVADPALTGAVGYYAMCECIAGRHYLGYDDVGSLIECTQQNGYQRHRFPTVQAANDAIEAWRRQQHESSETPQE